MQRLQVIFVMIPTTVNSSATSVTDSMIELGNKNGDATTLVSMETIMMVYQMVVHQNTQVFLEMHQIQHGNYLMV